MATATTDHQPGQQCLPFPHRTHRLGPGPVRRKPSSVGLVLLRRDVGWDSTWQKRQVLRWLHHHPSSLRPTGLLSTSIDLSSAVDVSARVDWVLEHHLEGRPIRHSPLQLTFDWPFPHAHPQLDLVLGQIAQDPSQGPQLLELAKDQSDHRLSLLVGVAADLAGSLPDVADWQGEGELAPPGLRERALVHPLLEDVELCLGHRAL